MIIRPISILNGTASELTRITNSKEDFNYNESWLQEVIHKNPQTYPIESNLNGEMKFISLGREINTGAGYIDVLLLNSDGELIIIETKLWKNPEKSRTVLAQIIDYAKELNKWSFDDLNNAVLLAQRSQNSSTTLSLEDIIKQEFNNQNHTDFIDTLINNLQEGNFILSIVGDKISPNLLLLSDTLQGSPGLNFSLHLIDMKLFSYKDEILLIPDIIGKTKEVIRGVVKVQYEKEKPKVEVKYAEDEKSKSPSSKTNKKTFVSQCPEDIADIVDLWLDKWQENNKLLVYWGVKGLSVRQKVEGKWKSIIDMYPYAISLITKDMADKNQIPNHIYKKYLDAIFTIENIQSAYSEKRRYIKYSTMSTEDIELMFESVGNLIEELVE
jgi:hypothetical protein